jgi:hypothetical protein
MRAKRIKISLNPGKEADRRVLDYLQSAGVSNSRAIIIAVLDYLDRQEQNNDNRAFLQEVRDTIRESVQAIPFSHSAGYSREESGEASVEDAVSPLDFLDSIAGGVTYSEL